MLGKLGYAARWRANEFLNNRSAKKLRASNNFYGPVLADALTIRQTTGEHAIDGWRSQIEQIRGEMLASNDSLEGWERPWLERSTELNLHISDQDRNHPSVSQEGMPIARAVRSSKPEKWCLTLFELVYRLRPSVVVEMGTNVGISGLYLAAAAKENGVTQIVTLEGSAPKASLARHHFEQLELTAQIEVVAGDFFETLPTVLAQYGSAIDMAFNDGFHDGEATIDFHQQFHDAMDSGLIVYDDIRWSKGMKHAWDQIRISQDVTLSVDSGSVGFCVLGHTSQNTKHIRCLHRVGE